jgi:hypothetical protein
MSAIPTNVGVFFGQVDKRATGWYWVDARGEKLRGASRSRQKSWRLRMPFRAFGKLQVMSHEKEALREHLGRRD